MKKLANDIFVITLMIIIFIFIFHIYEVSIGRIFTSFIVMIIFLAIIYNIVLNYNSQIKPVNKVLSVMIKLFLISTVFIVIILIMGLNKGLSYDKLYDINLEYIIINNLK